MRTLNSILVLSLVIFLPSLSRAQSLYTVTDLGVPVTWDADAYGGVNNSGVVAGSVATANGVRGFVYDPSRGGVTLLIKAGLAESRANDVNSVGVVVGRWTTITGFSAAFRYTAQFGFEGIAGLGGRDSSALGVNDNGDIVGWATTAAGVAHAFRYSASGQMTDVHLAAGWPATSSSIAQGIDNAGNIVGVVADAAGVGVAFSYSSSTGSFTTIGTLAGATSALLRVTGGTAVGLAAAGATEWRAISSRGAGVQDLGTLGGTTSAAYDVNASGQVVGAAKNANDEGRAFLYDANGSMRDLNALVTDPDWYLLEAQGINDSGQIVGVGYHDSDLRVFLLTPIAPASASALAVANASGTFGGSTTLAATLTAGGSPLVAQEISFSLNGSPVGTAITSGSGVATLSGVSLVGINAGTYAAGVQATFAGDATHVGQSASGALSIAKAVPIVSWQTPAAITVGTPLGSQQLNATASVPGTFSYTPPMGNLLGEGNGQTLTAIFTPADGANYTAEQAQVTIDVGAVGAATPAKFHAIGDLPGGPSISAVRDATTVGGVLYAVGASASHDQILCISFNNPAGCVTQYNPDTALLWTFDGVNGTLTPLPDVVTPTGTPVNPLFASAITRDAAYIASAARSNAAAPAQFLPVRVTRNGLVNLNLGGAPFPANSQPAAAEAISEDGSILYGVDGIPFRARRFDVNASTSVRIPLPSGSDTASFVASRGVSFDGSVMVGTSFAFPFTGTNGRAFRYVHAPPVGTVAAIPLLPGGTWSKALTVSPDGRRVLVAGNSTSLPNGEIYLYDAVTGTTTALGSPNTPWAPVNIVNGILIIVNFAGMTADGSVVAATFADSTNTSQGRSGHAYIHNAHGWFHLTTVLAQQGIDIQADGWSASLQIDGISPDGTLVFGSGEHNGNIEGFVAEFAPGHLASFDVPAVPQTDSSIVGLWTGNGTGGGEAIVFLADGTFFFIDTVHGTQSPAEYSSGFERGRYHWEASTGAFTFATRQDTNGSVGLSGGNGVLGLTANVSGDTLDIGNGGIVLTRVVTSPGSIVGGWVFGDPAVADSSGVVAFLPDGSLLFAKDGSSVVDPSGHDGVEGGTYTWNPPTGALAINVTIDTNAGWGFSNGPGTGNATLLLSADELHLGEPGDPNALTRIVDPNAVKPVITSALTATARVSVPFAYTIAATHAASFGATGLPGGLTFNPATGVIAGTPTAAGTFAVNLSATNSFGQTGFAPLTLTVEPAPPAALLAVADAGGSFGGTTTVSATLTSAGSPVAGQQLSFALNGTSVGTAATNASGVAMLANVSLAGINAGTYAGAVQAAYAGDATHGAAVGSGALTVAKAVPVITWPAPASITHGTALSAVQLNATANVPGTFVYTPAAGTLLPVGPSQTLSVTFAPTDSANYSSAQAQVNIAVTSAIPVARSVAIATQEGVATTGTLQATDLESDPLTFSIVTPPTKGSIAIIDAVTGAFSYTPNAGAIGYDTFTFQAADAGGASAPATGMVFIVAASPRWPGQTVRASVATGGVQSNGLSYLTNVNADGRYVTFSSIATNLVAGDTNAQTDVFVYDRHIDQTTRVSVASDGTQGNNFSAGSVVSADGRYVAFGSLASNLVAGDSNARTDVFVRDRQTGQTTRVSVSSTGGEANDTSDVMAVSADGRYVVFSSSASNLVANDANSRDDVFVHDRATGQTSRVSVSSTGIEGNGGSNSAAVSADGRYVAFDSSASNLVTGDSNGVSDVFVYDRFTAQTTRVSVASGGGQSNGNSFEPTVSADGRYVGFNSTASNLVPGDSNGNYDVFVYDRQTAQTTRVSVSSSGDQANGPSVLPVLSADGRYVAFLSPASNLAAGGTIADSVFVHDRQTGRTTLVSVASDGTAANGHARTPGMSADARFVTFLSLASSLVPFDTNSSDDIFVVGGVSVSPAIISVPAAGGTRSMSVSFDYPGTPWTATTASPWITINPPIGGTANATVSFTVAPNPGAARTGTVVVALQTITVNQDAASAPVAQNASVVTDEDAPVSGTLLATDPNGDPIAFSIVTQPVKGTVVITNSATGAFTYTPGLNKFGGDSFTFQATAAAETSNVATVSITINFVNDPPTALDGAFDAVEDTALTGFLSAPDPDSLVVTYEIVSQTAHGTVNIPNPTGSPLGGGSFTYVPNANYNGPDSFTFRAVDGTAQSNVATVTIAVAPVNDAPVATNAVVTTQERIAKSGTFLATDVEGDALTFSVVTPPTQGILTITDAATGAFTYTPNAGVVGYDTFTFQATDSAGGSATATGRAFIVASSPRWPGQTVRVSPNTFLGTADAWNGVPSADGRYVAFCLGTASGVSQFVYDRSTGQTSLASVASDGTPGNGSSCGSSISANGRYLAFASHASNLVAGDTNGHADVFVRDVEAGATARVSVAADGTEGNGDSWDGMLSADGRHVVFISEASNLVPGDTNGERDVFVYDRENGQISRVSVASDETQGNNDSESPALSADGRYVAFLSIASNLVAGDTNGLPDMFVHDRETGQTSRVSVASDGTQGYVLQLGLPALSADGRFVAFASDAPTLVPGDTNTASDVFVHDRATGQTTRASLASSGAQGNSSSFVPSLSADGRYVAFSSAASNLVAGDSNARNDMFVHDRQTGQTVRISVASDGTQGNGHSQELSFSQRGPVISADGRFVAFPSLASNLVSGDTDSHYNIFVVGGVSASPTTINAPASGGSQTVEVAFDYPGTPWTATTSTPWITIAVPNGGSANGAVNFAVAPNTGPTRTGTLTVALQTVTVIQGAATAPVAQDGAVTTAEDTSGAGTLSATDPNGDAVTYSLVGLPSKGTVILVNPATGAFTYTPGANLNGTDSFTFQATDGAETSNIATISITITPVNDAPIAQNGTLTVVAGGLAAGNLIAADAEGAALTYALAANGTKGSAVITNAATGAYTYTAAVGASGSDTFTFFANDASLDSNVATVTVTILAGNRPPIASNGALVTQEDKSASSTLGASDPDRDRLTFRIVVNGAKGTATITNTSTGRFTYVPAANATGSDALTFVANDGQTDSAAATVTVSITPVNDVPVAVGASYTVARNTKLNGQLSATDVDSSTLTYTIGKAPKKGSVSIDAATGAFAYTPATGFTGIDSFTFKVTDGAATSTATISITVN